MRVPLLLAALPLVSALPRGLLDKRTTDTVDPNRGRAADVNWDRQNDESRWRGRYPQGKDTDPCWDEPDWPEDPNFPPGFPEDNDLPEDDCPPEDDDLPGDNTLPEDNDLPEDDCPPEDDDLPGDNTLPEDNLPEDNDLPDDDCPPEDDDLPNNPEDNTPPKPSASTSASDKPVATQTKPVVSVTSSPEPSMATDTSDKPVATQTKPVISATPSLKPSITTITSDKPVPTQTKPVVSATPSPTEVPSGNDEPPYMEIVHKWLRKLNLRPLKYDAKLADNARRCSEESKGALTHNMYPGSNGQVMAPGKEDNFEHVFVGAWLGEIRDLFPDQADWEKHSQGWDYKDGNGHVQFEHAELLADLAKLPDGRPLKLTRIGCGWAYGIWTCDLA